MKPRAARRRFFSLLPAYGGELSLLSPDEGLRLMTRFYRYDRFSGCDPAEGQDTLFCEWAIREWERGEWFIFTIARQLTDGSKKGRSVRQLRLSFRQRPEVESRAVVCGSMSCLSPQDAEQFQMSVESTTAYRWLVDRNRWHVDLSFKPVR